VSQTVNAQVTEQLLALVNAQVTEQLLALSTKHQPLARLMRRSPTQLPEGVR
jgi:hypothetical protein